MPKRLTVLLALTALAALAMGGVLLMPGKAATTARIPFQIVTGAPSGTFFKVGEAMAGLLSHPPGMDRCNVAPVCGPTGLIISARTSPGAADNVTAVNSGAAESGLSNADLVAAAVRGRAPFRSRATHLRVIASLYDEDVHLVVGTKATIRSVTDLRGKRVARGNDRSGSGLAMREVLSAYGVSQGSLRLVRTDGTTEAALMKEGKIDAFFAVGGAPLAGLADLFAAGQARLVPIDGRGRDRLIKTVPAFSVTTIPPKTYSGQGEIQTVATRALWIVHESVPDQLVYGITRALLHPFNRNALSASHPSAREIALANATRNLPAPLHPGAARFYNDARKR